MKYINSKKNPDGRLDEDVVLELEYGDLISRFENISITSSDDVKARSFASLQLRAKNAIKELLSNKNSKLLLLCGSSLVDTNKVAYELVQKISKKDPTVSYAPSKAECFGSESVKGILSTKGVVIMPCSHLIDHPKWLGLVNASLATNHDLKLILTGDDTDCAALNMMWPTLDHVMRTDLVLEYPSLGAVNLMAGLIKDYQEKLSVKPFDLDAIKLLCSWATRQSGDRRYIGIPEIRLCNLVIAASSYATSQKVTYKNVLKAIGADDFRVNSLSVLGLRNHKDNQILLATRGESVGQINGLSVIETAGTSYEYGEPVRITATLRAGGEGDVIDIERKAELAGQIHAKAMMIINGFLSNEFCQETPMPVSASLVFEQSYSEIDGDSASLTGLCAVVSSLANLPIRQDLAVTGAVDQFGDVQPVGGLNEKIEGFYKICRLHGFTGTQGVIIPISCINQLVLRPSVVNAVKKGKFHIYVVGHVTGAAKLLMNTVWGDENIENSIYSKICDRLDSISNVRETKNWWHFW